MSTPKIGALGITQDGFTKCCKATGYVEGIAWLEAWGATLVQAMEALQAQAATIMTERGTEEEDS